MRLNPQFANLSPSRMGVIGPGITSIEEVLEFPVKRMSKGAKIYSSSTHKEGLTWSWSSHLQILFVDLVNTVSRDNVSIQSNQILLRAGTTCFTLKMWTMRWFCRGTIVTQLLSLLHLQSEKCRICPQQELIDSSHYL